jgi:hypothetical protein
VNRRETMAETTPNDRPVVTVRSPVCRHLRTNGMYIFDGASEGAADDDYEPSACWCLQTMKSFGPDDDLVGRRDCRNAGRSCYEPL